MTSFGRRIRTNGKITLMTVSSAQKISVDFLALQCVRSEYLMFEPSE